jgi:hypothetical protein
MYIDLGLLYSNLGGLADCPEEVFSQLADHLLEGLNRWASYTGMCTNRWAPHTVSVVFKNL